MDFPILLQNLSDQTGRFSCDCRLESVVRKNKDLMEIMGEVNFERFFNTLSSYAQALENNSSTTRKKIFNRPIQAGFDQ